MCRKNTEGYIQEGWRRLPSVKGKICEGVGEEKRNGERSKNNQKE